MKLIELHILQSFPVSCLNRDDVGAPKTAIFGGANRAVYPASASSGQFGSWLRTYPRPCSPGSAAV